MGWVWYIPKTCNMTQKILYAVQAKAIEDVITRTLNEQTNGAVVNVGTAGYREQVIPSLKQSGADILLYREDLKGSMDIFQLMCSIREDFPHVRIVFIANRQEATSRLLCSLVFLGIYDIINENAVAPTTIINHILHPHNFGDVAKYFHPQYMDEYMPEAPAQADAAPAGMQAGGKGFLGGLIKNLGGMTKPAAPAAPVVQPVQAVMETPVIAQAPTVDLESMRNAMLEDARRTAQKELGQLVADQVMVETLAMKEEIDQSKETISRLTADLREKTVSESQLKLQLEDAIKLKKSAEESLASFRESAELTNQQYQAQLIQLQATKPPDWYHEQTQKWLAERSQYKATISSQEQALAQINQQLTAIQGEKARLERELEERDEKIESMALAVPREVSTAIDATLEDDYVIIPDNESEYRQTIPGEGKLIAFMGTKHGTGNTTVALNTAVALANAGFKTCFIELNRNFPMVSGFFEFNNIAFGLDTAIVALQQNNYRMASRCIIKPHGVNTSNKNVKKVYDRLPGPLHFMLYSNEFLLKSKTGDAPYISERDLKDLAYFLTVQERYSYVVIDLQPDDQESLNTFLASPYRVHQLVLTMTQDTHGIKTAGLMITALARSRGGDLVRSTEFVVNEYSTKNKMSSDKICDILHIPRGRLSKISLDSEGYMNANYAMVPYILSKGKYVHEYMDLRMHLAR